MDGYAIIHMHVRVNIALHQAGVALRAKDRMAEETNSFGVVVIPDDQWQPGITRGPFAPAACAACGTLEGRPSADCCKHALRTAWMKRHEEGATSAFCSK